MTTSMTLTERAFIVNGNYTAKWEPGTQTITLNAEGADAGIFDATSGGANVPKANLSTEGHLFLRNLDFTKAVTLLTTGGDSFGLLNAGETAHFRTATGIEIVADTTGGAVNVQYLWLED